MGFKNIKQKKKTQTNSCFFSWRLEFSTQKYVGTFQLQRFQKQHTIIILCEHEKQYTRELLILQSKHNKNTKTQKKKQFFLVLRSSVFKPFSGAARAAKSL